MPLRTLVEEMKTIMKESKEIEPKTEKEKEFQIRFAWAVLHSRYASRGNTVDCYVMPISTPRANLRKVKGEMTWVGDLTALIAPLPKDDEGNIIDFENNTVPLDKVIYAHGTFWRDGAKNLQKVKKGKVYRASLLVNESKSGWGATISSDRASFTPVDNVKMPSFDEFFKKEILPRDTMIKLGEIDLFKSNDATDIKVIEVTVAEANVAESSDGTVYGYYSVMDLSTVGTQIRFFVAPEDVNWMVGSVLYFGGIIQEDNNGNPVFRVHFIHPTEMAQEATYEIPSKSTDTAVMEEAVDVTTDNSSSDVETVEEQPEPVKQDTTPQKSEEKPQQSDKSDIESIFEIG